MEFLWIPQGSSRPGFLNLSSFKRHELQLPQLPQLLAWVGVEVHTSYGCWDSKIMLWAGERKRSSFGTLNLERQECISSSPCITLTNKSVKQHFKRSPPIAKQARVSLLKRFLKARSIANFLKLQESIELGMAEYWGLYLADLQGNGSINFSFWQNPLLL